MIAAALIASIGGLLNDFVYDDVPLVRDNVRVHGLGHWRELLSRPYWPPPFVEQLYRPVASLLVAVEYGAGGGHPLVFRVVSYALYALCAALFYELAARLVSRHAAFCTAILFAVHPVHVEAVALAVNQGELVVASCALACTILYLDRRRADGLSARDWSIIAVLYAVAALTKESGLIIPALLVAAEATVVSGDGKSRERARLWGGYVFLGVVALIILRWRAAVLGDAVGAIPAQSIRGLGLGDRIFTMLQVVPMWLRLFAWPAHLQADYAPSEIARPASFGVAEAFGVTLIVSSVALVVFTRRRAPVVCFGLSWCIVALLPVSNIVPSGVMLAERTLLLPSAGFLLAVCGIAQWIVGASADGARGSVRRGLYAGFALLAVLGVARSAGRHRVWNSAHLRVVTPEERRGRL